ncbi:MAG: hypothetical protein HUU21_21100 [Polyangiaceae bacterium]|nr:hypothetical protein [Polyangiaceae bacterium]NUQ76045.1 hypothetical protein [Polyangiaceae bacterium]
MDIKADVTLAFPLDRVFSAYRDRLSEVTEHLPNIRRIQVLSREDAGDVVHLVNEWTGGGDIPKAALAVLKESMLRWTDYATWTTSTRSVAWRTEVGAFPGVVKSSGTNRFVEVPSGTRLEIRGTLVCDAAKLPGVPRLLAGGINPVVEKFLVGQVSVNSVEVAKALGKLLERDAARPS